MTADLQAPSGLVVHGVSKTFPGNVRALDGASLSVPLGLYGLLGPNGAGKTTLMRVLATLLTPDSGSVRLDGLDAVAEPERLRRRLGYLPQQFSAYPGVSGFALVERFAWLKGQTDRRARRRQVAELLERVNLEADADRIATTYSGGMLRRLGIAIALIGEPRLLIVDEPTAGLDPAERNRFHRVLAEVAEGAAVLLSTHIVEDIERLCTRLAVLHRGRVVAEGASDELIDGVRGRLWERVVARNAAEPAAMVRAIPTPQGLKFVVAGTEAPDGFAPREPDLEDVFHLLTDQSEAAA